LASSSNSAVNKNIYEDYWEITTKGTSNSDFLIATCTFNFQNSNFTTVPDISKNNFNLIQSEYLTDYKDTFYIKVYDGSTDSNNFSSEYFPANTLCGTYISPKTISLSGITIYNQKESTFSICIYAKAQTTSGASIKIKQISLLGAFNETTSINNGNYYAQNYSNSNYLTVIKCAEISSNLSGY
jgi:hypothetical protein